MANKPKADTGKNRAKQRRHEKRRQMQEKHEIESTKEETIQEDISTLEISEIDSKESYAQQDDLSAHTPSSGSILKAALQGFEPETLMQAAKKQDSGSIKDGSIGTIPSNLSVSISSSNLQSIRAKVQNIEDEMDKLEGRGALIIDGTESSNKQTNSSMPYNKEDNSSITSDDKSSFAKIPSRQSSLNEEADSQQEVIDLGGSTNLAATLQKASLQGTGLLQTVQLDDENKDNGYVHVEKHELTRSKSFEELLKRQEEQQKKQSSGFIRNFFG